MLWTLNVKLKLEYSIFNRTTPIAQLHSDLLAPAKREKHLVVCCKIYKPIKKGMLYFGINPIEKQGTELRPIHIHRKWE